MKLSKVLLSSALAAALVLGVASCKTEEDDLGIIDQIEEDGYTNDTDTYYARGYVSTNTKHLAADCEIQIDTNASSNAGYTMGYIFNQIGKGTEEEPYSFIAVGIRYVKANLDNSHDVGPEYFVSYYEGVRSEDFTTNAGDFDVSESEAKEWSTKYGTTVSANSAKEYPIGKTWDKIPSGKYTLENGILTVYIDLSVYSGETEITTTSEANANTVKEIYDADGDPVKQIVNGSYKITLKASATATSGHDITVKKGSDSVPSTFAVQEAKLGRYAMVSKGSTLKGTWTLPKDSYLKSAANPNGEVFIWDEEIDNVR